MSALWGNVGAGRSFLSPVYDHAYRKAGHTHTQTPADTVAVYDSRLIRAVWRGVGGVAHLAAGQQPRHSCCGDTILCFYHHNGEYRLCHHRHGCDPHRYHCCRYYNSHHTADLHRRCHVAVHVFFGCSVYDEYHPLDYGFLYRDDSKCAHDNHHDNHHQEAHGNHHHDNHSTGQEISRRMGHGVSLHHGGWPTHRGGYVDV